MSCLIVVRNQSNKQLCYIGKSALEEIFSVLQLQKKCLIDTVYIVYTRPSGIPRHFRGWQCRFCVEYSVTAMGGRTYKWGGQIVPDVNNWRCHCEQSEQSHQRCRTNHNLSVMNAGRLEVMECYSPLTSQIFFDNITYSINIGPLFYVTCLFISRYAWDNITFPICHFLMRFDESFMRAIILEFIR